MALYSDTVMVLYYDIVGDNADHDDWHTYEHMHERLSIAGFERGSRWIATTGAPRYMVLYEVASPDVATSPAYLDRLNNPTPWTSSMMSRFRNMVRGFCTVVASAGCGIGNAAVSVRFAVADGREPAVCDHLARDILPAMSSRRGMAGVQVLQPAPPPPMTREQSLRGADTPMSWLLLATGYDSEALSEATAAHVDLRDLERYGASPAGPIAKYALHYTLTSREAQRTPAKPPLSGR
jgi:hypothetical protein